MSTIDHLSEIESLRSQVAELQRAQPRNALSSFQRPLAVWALRGSRASVGDLRDNFRRLLPLRAGSCRLCLALYDLPSLVPTCGNVDLDI